MVISGNAKDGSYWHAAVRHEDRGPVTGKLLRVYYVARCTGKQPGGGYGSTVKEVIPEMGVACPKCSPFMRARGCFQPEVLVNMDARKVES